MWDCEKCGKEAVATRDEKDCVITDQYICKDIACGHVTTHMTRLVTCRKCGGVSFAYDKEKVVKAVYDANLSYSKLPAKDRVRKGVTTAASFQACPRCGGSYKNFRDAVDGDCPMGVTLQPVQDRLDRR